MSYARTAEAVDSTDVDVPYWIQTTAGKYAQKSVHIPADHSTRENPDSLCSSLENSESVKTKDPAVFPPGYRTVCRECLYYRRER